MRAARSQNPNRGTEHVGHENRLRTAAVDPSQRSLRHTRLDNIADVSRGSALVQAGKRSVSVSAIDVGNRRGIKTNCVGNKPTACSGGAARLEPGKAPASRGSRPVSWPRRVFSDPRRSPNAVVGTAA